MRKKGGKEDERIIIRCNIDKSALLAARSQGMKTKHAARKCLRQRMEIIYRADDAMAAALDTILMRNRVDMLLKERAIAMSDQFNFDSVRDEGFDAKPMKHDG